MPYYWRRRNYNQRRNWIRRWRPRGPFRWRRRRWRRRRKVKKKLSKIKIEQYQPPTIRRCSIKGLHPLFICNKETISKNFRQWEFSIIPEHWPGGGGFSITKYSLEGLFEQHELDRNWWTKSNMQLPLIRYLYATFKFYRSRDVDYVVNVYTCQPMLATAALYTSCQPSMMMMHYNSIFVPSKITNPKGKNYRKIRVRPPEQLESKWYFSKDLCKQGLVLITCSACSFDNYYISTQAESNNISFNSLNTNFFKMRNFQQPPSTGYSPYIHGTIDKRLWSTTTVVTNPTSLTMSDLTYLGETKVDQPGKQIRDVNGTNWWDTYFGDWKNWGNIFSHENLTISNHILVSTKPLSQLKQTYANNKQKTLEAGDFTVLTDPLYIRCRYNPERDTGKDTTAYILSTIRDQQGWDPPGKTEFIIEGYPVWLLLFGWLDWQRQLAEATNLNRSYVLVIDSPYITPELPYYVVLDDEFIEGHSLYIPHDTTKTQTDTDRNNWFPCVLYQTRTVEKIVSSGPGTVKFNGKKSLEAKVGYNFRFKFGGCPPKTDKITDPCEQPFYPVPRDEHNVYSLQNPNTPPETFLYQFDFKRDLLTEPAAKRIKRDYQTSTSLFSTTGSMQLEAALPETTQTPQTSEEETEENEEALLQQLRHQRNKRKQLQRRLLQLMYQT